jgi:hypothetical protein
MQEHADERQPVANATPAPRLPEQLMSEVPEVFLDPQEWLDRNAAAESAANHAVEPGVASMVPGRDYERKRRSSRHGRSPSDTESSTTSSDYYRSRKRKHRRKEKRRKSSTRRKRRHHRDASLSPTNHEKRDDGTSITSLWRNSAMPKMKEVLTHDEMRLAWPTWRDMLITILKLHKPANRDWTEEEKYLTLMMYGGSHVTDVASFTAPVEGEIPPDAHGFEHRFTNLVTRCNVTYRPRDVTAEITSLRNMIQKKTEPVREYLDRVRKQLTLCGYRTTEERDRELVMLLKINTIDAIDISKQATGKTAAQMEELALNLEAIRSRQVRSTEKVATQVTVEKEEVDIHAVSSEGKNWPGSQRFEGQNRGRENSQRRNWPERGRSRFSSANQFGSRRCDRCGRPGGHDSGFSCKAFDLICFKCNKRGHVERVCKSGQQQTNRGGYSQSGSSKSVNSVGARERDGNSASRYQVQKEEEGDWVA